MVPTVKHGGGSVLMWGLHECCWFRGILKRQVKYHSPSSIQSLKEVILEEWKKIDLANVANLFIPCLEYLVLSLKIMEAIQSTRFSSFFCGVYSFLHHPYLSKTEKCVI